MREKIRMKSAEILRACDQAVSAAANGMAAGILLVVLVGCGLRWAGGTNAATRHALWFGMLLLLVALLPAQLWRDSLNADGRPLAPEPARQSVEWPVDSVGGIASDRIRAQAAGELSQGEHGLKPPVD